MGEGEEAVTLTGEDRGLEIEAGTVTVNPHLDANSILTSHLAFTEVVDLPVLALVPVLLCDRPLTDAAMRTVIVLARVTATAAPTVDPYPPTSEGAVEANAVRTMVIDTDPNPAVMHHAHVFPEETDKDGVLSPVA